MESNAQKVFSPSCATTTASRPSVTRPSIPARSRHHGLASYIWGGQVSQDTCVKMLDRVRSQFREPQWHGHEPLILPAQIPSASRPPNQEVPRFSRGIQLLRSRMKAYYQREPSGDSQGGRGKSQGSHSSTMEDWWSPEEKDVLSGIQNRNVSRSISKDILHDKKVNTTKSLTSAAITSLSHMGFAAERQEGVAAAICGSGAGGGKTTMVPFRRKEMTQPQGTGSSCQSNKDGGGGGDAGYPVDPREEHEDPSLSTDSSNASIPIYELSSLESKVERLHQMEILERKRVENTETWDRQLVKEMMVVHYVTSVLKQQMEEIKIKERAVRGVIRYEEEKDFYYLYNESPIAQTISKEWKALREKEIKLARIKEREELYKAQKSQQSRGESAATNTTGGSGTTRTGTTGVKAGGTWGGEGEALLARTKSVLLSSLQPTLPSAKDANKNFPQRRPGVSAQQPSAATKAGGLGRAAGVVGRRRFPGFFGDSGANASTLPSRESGLPARGEHPTGMDFASHEEGLGSSTSSFSQQQQQPTVIKVDPGKLLSDEVHDARAILEKYCQQKQQVVVEGGRHKGNAFILPSVPAHVSKTNSSLGKAQPICSGPSEGRRVSSLVLPSINTVTVSRRAVVGVADYISLLDDDDQYRALIEISEKEERRDIQRLMTEDWKTVRDWQRKCMHLQRLVYWREQREEGLREEVVRLTQTVGPPLDPALMREMEHITHEETMKRMDLHHQEQQDRQERMLELRHQLEIDQQGFFYEHVTLDKSRLVEWYYSGCLTITMAEEHHARLLREKEERVAFESGLVQQSHILRLLHEVESRPNGVAAVETIQRAYYRYRRGLLGYRRSHKLLGREIQSKRTQKKLAEGLQVFAKYRSQLHSEINAVHKHEREEFSSKAQKLWSTEFSDRFALISYEAKDWTSIQRSFLRILRDDIIGGAIRREIQQEYDERMELSVKAELFMESIYNFSKCCRHLIHKKETLVFEERRERKGFVMEEARQRELLRGDEGREQEEIRLEEVAQLAREAAARAAIAETILSDRKKYAVSMLCEHEGFLNKLQQKAVTKLTFEGHFYNHLLYVETLPALWKAWREWAEQGHHVAQQVTWNAFRQLHKGSKKVFTEEMEIIMRRELGNEEAATRNALLQKHLAVKQGWKALEDEEERAAQLLCHVWRQYRNKNFGRTATRKFLHDAFQEKRDRHYISTSKAAQKALLTSVRRKLEEAENEATIGRALPIAAGGGIIRLMVLLEDLEYQEEPKKRWEIKEEEEMIFNILRNNCFSFHIRRFDNRNHFAVLWQQESYERVTIQRAWWKQFAKVFYPKKEVIKEEVLAIIIQRAWRAHLVRRAKFAIRAAQHEELFAAELSDRLFTMEREAVNYMELYHTVMNMECEATWMFSIQPQMTVFEAQQCSITTLLREEWTERCKILWEMRYELADGSLMSSEQNERKELIQNHFLPLLEITAFWGEETIIRLLLQNERRLFLLRLTAKQEAEARLEIMKEYKRTVGVQWVISIQESLHRRVLVESDYVQFWGMEVYALLALQEKKDTVNEERQDRHTTIVCMEEWSGRQSLYHDEAIDRQKVVLKMEWIDRGIVQTREQFSQMAQVHLPLMEEKQRAAIKAAWQQGLHYIPSSFAPTLVYQQSSLFARGVMEAEALVRRYLEESQKTAWEYLTVCLKAFVEESRFRISLYEEEKRALEQGFLQVEESDERRILRKQWGEGLFYVPSSFAPIIVNQPMHLFTDGIAETERYSRDYVELTEVEEFKDIERGYRLIHEEGVARQALEQREAFLREVMLYCGLKEAVERSDLELAHHMAICYAPSRFAPHLVWTRISLFAQCLLDEEELLRSQLEQQEWKERTMGCQAEMRAERKMVEEALAAAKETDRQRVVIAGGGDRREVSRVALLFPSPRFSQGGSARRSPSPKSRALSATLPVPALPSASIAGVILVGKIGASSKSPEEATKGDEKNIVVVEKEVKDEKGKGPDGMGNNDGEMETKEKAEESIPLQQNQEVLPAPPSSIVLPGITVSSGSTSFIPSSEEDEEGRGRGNEVLSSASRLTQYKAGGTMNGRDSEAEKEEEEKNEGRVRNDNDDALALPVPSPLPSTVLQNSRYVYYVNALESLERQSRKHVCRMCIRKYLSLLNAHSLGIGAPQDEVKWVDMLARDFLLEDTNETVEGRRGGGGVREVVEEMVSSISDRGELLRLVRKEVQEEEQSSLFSDSWLTR